MLRHVKVRAFIDFLIAKQVERTQITAGPFTVSHPIRPPPRFQVCYVYSHVLEGMQEQAAAKMDRILSHRAKKAGSA
jgi:hypothetical protein